ncbi:MAG: hypothetical protein NUV32_09365 [Exilispira sp.]|nr:hypothetical protein [Exilispira sp.]
MLQAIGAGNYSKTGIIECIFSRIYIYWFCDIRPSVFSSSRYCWCNWIDNIHCSYSP